MNKDAEFVHDKFQRIAYTYLAWLAFLSFVLLAVIIGVAIHLSTDTNNKEMYCAQNETIQTQTTLGELSNCLFECYHEIEIDNRTLYGANIQCLTGCSQKNVTTNKCLDWRWRDK